LHFVDGLAGICVYLQVGDNLAHVRSAWLSIYNHLLLAIHGIFRHAFAILLRVFFCSDRSVISILARSPFFTLTGFRIHVYSFTQRRHRTIRKMIPYLPVVAVRCSCNAQPIEKKSFNRPLRIACRILVFIVTCNKFYSEDQEEIRGGVAWIASEMAYLPKDTAPTYTLLKKA
jgi:hypothetical protein